jgi:tRNA1Val (adenine37-N6)-methyltransferase
MSKFQFKQFSLEQSRCAMKIGTDGVLLGAWTPITNNPFSILDIGTGTGSLLMLAQRSTAEQIDALEIDQAAYEQAVDNFENSPERSLILSSAYWLKNQKRRVSI